MKDKRFLTTQQMLEWQYFQILGELQELQRHDSDPTCPCRLSDDLGENCLAKHSLGLSVIAAETAAMETDKKNASMLWELSADAKDRHQKIKGFLCHENDGPEFGDWSRQWRKKIEPIYYHKSCNVKLRDEAELEDTPATKEVNALKSLAKEVSTSCPEDSKSYQGISKDIVKRADTIDRIVEDLMRRPAAVEPTPRPQPAPTIAPAPTCPINKTFAMGITTTTRYEFVWKLVEAKDLVTSHDAFTFAVNAKFVQALQPRLRDRAATQIQVMNIASKLEPDLLLQDFLSLEKGAPIIDNSNLVLCGNGRVMGIVRAIKENPDRYRAYRARLMEMAPRYSFDAAQVDRMKSPVLVRVLTTPADKKAFAEECNASTVIEASPIEKAKTDAEKITPAMLNSIIVLENESIFDAIKAMRNKAFVVSYLNKLPPNEQAGLVDAKGVLSQAGTRRIAMALFVATFKGEVGIRLAEKFFESNDPDVLTVFSGITRSLSALAQVEALVASGQRQADYAFGEDLAKVVSVYSTIKQTEGMTVAKYINQAQAFGRQLNPFQERVLLVIADNARSGKRIGAILSAYAQAVIDSPSPSQGGLMALEPITKSQLFESAVKRATTVTMEDVARLFDKTSDRLRAGAVAMQKVIDEKRNPAIAQQNITARRSRIASSMSEDADRLEQVQKAMQGVADAIDASLMQSFLRAPQLSDTIEQYVPDQSDPDIDEVQAEILQGLRDSDVIDDIVAQLFDHSYTWLAKKLDNCNLTERDQVVVFGWRPLRNFLSWAVSRKEPVQVCAAGMTHGVYQISIIGVEGGRDSDISMRAKSVPGLKRVFSRENNAVFEIVVPEDAEKSMEWQPQEINLKSLRKEPAEQTALFDKPPMLRSDPVDGKLSSVDIPLHCGSQPVDPAIANAIDNAEDV